MPAKQREKSPVEDISFIPPKHKQFTYTDEITFITLPLINTILPQIANPEVDPVPETAVGIAYTNQQQAISSLDSIDISRISAKRSSSKNGASLKPYKKEELSRIARSIGIKPGKLGKPDLANLIIKELDRLRSERK